MTKISHADRAHALCSASGSERWLNCPGSVAFAERLPTPPSSEHAAEGTLFHELCELVIAPIVFHFNKTKKLPDRRTINLFDNLPGVAIQNYKEEMRDYAEEFVSVVYDLVKRYKPKRICIEEKVTLDAELGMFGTADFFFAFHYGKAKRPILLVMDIKYGRGKVVEPSSPQLIYYGAAIQETYQKVQFQEIWLHIWQPRAEHEDGPLREYRLKKREVQSWTKKLKDGARTALAIVNEDREPTSNELKAGDWCGFCAAKAVCKEHIRYLDAQAGLDFADEASVLVPAIRDQRLEIRSFLTDEQVSKLLRYKKDIESFLSALSEYAINRDAEGDPLPGWKVVQSKGRRTWIKDVAHVGSLLKLAGVSDPFDKKLRGIGSIEKELKRIGIANPSEAIEELVEMTKPRRTLVESTDPRPAINANMDAASDFTAINPE